MKNLSLEVVSPPRCGSTLLYFFTKKYLAGRNNNFFNICKDVNKHHPPFADHQFRFHNFNFDTFYLFAIRHPFSQLASLLIYDSGNEFDTLETFNERYLFNKVNDVVNDYNSCYDIIKNNSNNIAVFYYEKFVNDFNYFFDYFQETFGFTFSENERNNFQLKYNANSLSNLKALKEKEWDNYYSFSDNHISKNKGSNEENIMYIPFKFRSRIQREFLDIYKKFNYLPVSLPGIRYERFYNNTNCCSD